MRNFILSFALFISITAVAESLPKDYWYVSSDTKVDSIDGEICIVQGIVADYLGEKVSSGLISTLDRSKFTRTDSSGNFRLVLSKLDTALFFYHEKYSEIVCWKYNFQGGHMVQMHFVCSEKLPDGMMIMEEKPVVYLKSTEDIAVEISYQNSSDFTFTYPKYRDMWNVELANNQIWVDGKQYPYLFWEGTTDQLNFSSSIDDQCFAKTDTLTEFMANYLKECGFNANERTDFITYWMPRVVQFDYIKFELLHNEEFNSRIGEVNIHPAPNNMTRLFFIWEGYNNDLSDIYLGLPKVVSATKTEGFTYLEWGGSEIKSRLEN